MVTQLKAQEQSRLALEGRTLDRVSPGEQQPEVEHNVTVEGSTTGVNQGRLWREASGWFSYDLGTRGERRPLALIVTYSGGERGRRFEIRLDDRAIADVALDGREPDRFVDVTYPIPRDLVEAATDGTLTLTFAARPGSRTGGVYDVRLVRQGDASDRPVVVAHLVAARVQRKCQRRRSREGREEEHQEGVLARSPCSAIRAVTDVVPDRRVGRSAPTGCRR